MNFEALETADRAVAVVGVGAILPDAPDAKAFWQNVISARYSITDVPKDRWSAEQYYDADPKAVGKTYSKIAGWVRGFQFDSLRFRIPPRVASAMDEAQMWGVSATREALLDAGHPDRALNLSRTATVLGNAMGGELHYLTTAGVTMPPAFLQALEHSAAFSRLDASARETIRREVIDFTRASLPGITEDSMPGELANVVAGRIAHVFDLNGPNYVVDAACASSLAAIDSAIGGLLSNHFDVAVTGGIDRNMGPGTFVKFCKIGALSPDGSRPFSKGANGFVMGEGAAVLLLKRLADAEKAGDKIYAVIRGIGGSSDGKGKGITAPNPEGQKRAIVRALERSGIHPSTIGLVEAHGTSTRVGDAAEVASLHEVYRSLGLPQRSIALGSVKSQIGHLKAAAGAAGMLKAVLALHHKVLPPSAQFHEPNPECQFETGPFYVNTEARPWERNGQAPRRAAVSAFGFGGTNFHVILEEHVPGMLTSRRPQVQVPGAIGSSGGGTMMNAAGGSPEPKLLRGMVMVHGKDLGELKSGLVRLAEQVERGQMPAMELPTAESMKAPERIAIDYGDKDELLARTKKAIEACDDDRPAAWRLLRGQSVFRGKEAPGKVAFLFPGQGSQYVNMLRELRDGSETVRRVFDEADRVMKDKLDGRLLTELIYVRDPDKKRLEEAEAALRHTTVTQPAMLAADIALASLLADYGITPDMVVGHSLGEYAALVAAGVMPFEDALIAVSARAKEMASVSLADSGKMAGVIGPYEKIEAILAKVDGYVVPANKNSRMQTVIAGSSDGVEKASEMLKDAGLRVIPLSVSHAFHSEIVAPASEPLRNVLRRLRIKGPNLPIISNVTGDLYPMDGDAEKIVDLLGKQIASPVQFVQGLESLYREGVRVFVEVGPKKVLASFAEDAFEDRKDSIIALATNNPKKGPEASFGAALAYLYSVGRGRARSETPPAPVPDITSRSGSAPSSPTPTPRSNAAPVYSAPVSAAPAVSVVSNQDGTFLQLGKLFAEFLDRGMQIYQGGAAAPTASRSTLSTMAAAPSRQGSVVISGAGIGLPGTDHRLFDDRNFDRILAGDQFIEPIPHSERHKMVDKNVVMLVKRKDGSASLDRIDDVGQVLKLAGRRGPFDLADDFGVPKERVEAFDVATSMAIGAGMEALRDAGIPLVRRYKKTSKGTYLPDRWMLPESLADETGVVFASAFPGYNRFADLQKEYYEHKELEKRLADHEELRKTLRDGQGAAELDKLIAADRRRLQELDYMFERKFLFEILSMGHSQFAEYIGARGPNTSVNSACASTTLAVSVAEDWIRRGRCNRVIVIGADDVTSDQMLPWIGAGFLASGAATTEEDVTKAALPFDRRRHGMILGMGACALVVESEDAVRQRGMRGICEVLESESVNSAFHGTRLDVDHIKMIVRRFVDRAEQNHGLDRSKIAPHTVFISHETYTPARGGSAAAEVMALREAFGESASQIVIANIKGFTGHPMAVGLEDAMAAKILERQIVPPIPNFKEVDPELGVLNLSKGGHYPIEFALRFAAGFGSQLAMTLTRRIAGQNERVRDSSRYGAWLCEMSGYGTASTEISQRTLRVRDTGVPEFAPRPTGWVRGSVPVAFVEYGPSSFGSAQIETPAPSIMPPAAPVTEYKSASLSSAPPAAAADPVTPKVLEIFAAKTGYPTEMLALDLDIEADLGIDTVKQAEIFAEIRQSFGLPKRDDLKLRDYPTLNHILGFVREGRPDLAVAAAPAASAAPAPQAAATDPISPRVLDIVAAKTGYPKDMLALDLDLEADLGIDTVKQAEVFAELRQAFELPRRDDLKLRDYPTLQHVIGYVRAGRPDLAVAPAPQPAAQPAPAAASAPAAAVGGHDEITAAVVQIVADKTGYPADMLALDLDLEADLGVDTVKQAEVFAVVRERFGIARIADLKLRDYPTLSHVVGFVRQHVGAAAPAAQPAAAAAPAAAANKETGSLGKARRLVPTPMVRASLEACKPSGVEITNGTRILIVPDSMGVADLLADSLRKRGAEVHVAAGSSRDELVAEAAKWVGDRGLNGMFFLRGLDTEPVLDTIELEQWRAMHDRGARTLFALSKAIYPALQRKGLFILTPTRMGGTFGYGTRACEAPVSGAVSGFTKALSRELGDAFVKVVDFESTMTPDRLVQLIIAEVERDPGALEVGYADGLRFGITLLPIPGAKGNPIDLGPDTVFVVTGAGGAITSAIASNLAGQSKGTFHLLDLARKPDPNESDIVRFRNDKEGLKKDLVERLRKTNERVTPVMVDRELGRIERDVATVEAIAAVERAGGKVHYHACDVTDGEAISRIIGEIGKVDVVVHAAGLERSRPIDSKDQKEFDLIFDVKAMGMYHVLRALRGKPLGAIVSFSSVAGRFGNAGQVDYSSGNDLLCKITSSLRITRPETNGFVVDWTAWGGIGMATRGSIPEIMRRAGIDMLDPNEGIPVIGEELMRGSRGEAVVAGALGYLVAPRDADGGVQVVRQHGDIPLPLTVVRADPYEGVVLETELDPKEPFLNDHRIDGVPVLPGVMGVEIFARAAAALAPNLHPVAMLDVRFEAPLKCYRDEKRTATVTMKIVDVGGELRALCQLSSVPAVKGATVAPEPKRHFTATLVLAQRPSDAPLAEVVGTEPASGTVKREDLYRAYFHDESFRVLEKTEVAAGGKGLIGRLAQPLPALFKTPETRALTAPRLLELCFQTAGVVEIGSTRKLGLPSSIEEIRIHQGADDSAPRAAQVELATGNGDGLKFNATVRDDSGAILLEMRGYRTSALPSTMPEDIWAPLGAGITGLHS